MSPYFLRAPGAHRLFVPLAAVAMLAALSACATGGQPLRSGDACGAGASQGVVGSNRASADAFAAQRNAAGTPARVAGPTDAITTDVNPARLNIIVDGGGTVISVACG